jgi:cephalosporin hydroxylase
MMGDREIVDQFHTLYYSRPEQTIYDTYWLGVAAQKYPSDLWVYQEIITELRPDFIIETGTYWGGSALYLASICELLGHGQIITIDTVDMAESAATRPEHARITYLHGSSIEAEVVEKVRALVADAGSIMVILDSDHSREHVVNELKIYSEFVTPDSYLIVEDTNINGHPVFPEFGPGPMEALDLFLSTSAEFMPDPSREKFFVTANPRGFLRRVQEGGLRARCLEAEQRLSEQEVRVREAVAELEEAQAKTRSQLEDRDAQLEDRKAQLEDKEAQLNAAQAELLSLRARDRELSDTVRAAEQAITSLENSASWRLTSVLRRAKHLLRGGN